MSNTNSINQLNSPFYSGTSFDYGEVSLETVFGKYVMLLKQNYRRGPAYCLAIEDVGRYVLPIIGNAALDQITADVLKSCYNHAREVFLIPVSVIIGMNRLLEVIFDSLVRPGLYHRNPAAEIAAEYATKTQRKLPYAQYPIIISKLPPADPAFDCGNSRLYTVFAPHFPNIYYLGSDSIDGVNLVRRALIDELEINPQSDLDLTFCNNPMESDSEIVMVELNT